MKTLLLLTILLLASCATSYDYTDDDGNVIPPSKYEEYDIEVEPNSDLKNLASPDSMSIYYEFGRSRDRLYGNSDYGSTGISLGWEFPQW